MPIFVYILRHTGYNAFFLTRLFSLFIAIMFTSIFVLFIFVGYLIIPLTVLALLLIPTISKSESQKLESRLRALRELRGWRNESEKKWNVTNEEAESSGLSSSDDDGDDNDGSTLVPEDVDGDDESISFVRERRGRNGQPSFERSDMNVEYL